MTKYIANHPGGNSKILLAVGKAIDPFWRVYQQHHNSTYSLELLEDSNYQKLLDTVCSMNIVNPYLDNILDSHDVVAYLMITMNYLSAIELNRNNIGIFRNVKESELSIDIPSEIPVKVRKFIKNFRSSGGNYSREMTGHVTMTLDAYTHITSPIRRLVDLLNIMILQDTLGLYSMSSEALGFYNNWIYQLDLINNQMKQIRKVQNTCIMLNYYNKIEQDYYSGYIVGIQEYGGKYRYTIYFPSIQKIQNYSSRNLLELYSKQEFKIYMFKDKNEISQKIKLELKQEL